MTIADQLPLVTAIIPYFNREKTILRALNSIELQTYPNIEIIIVDDGSAIPLDKLVRSFGLSREIAILRQDQNLGPSAARNRGIAAAAGRFVAFLDSDDEWERDKIRLQVEAALASRDPDCVFCVSATSVRRQDDGAECHEIWNPSAEPLGDFLFLRAGTLQTSSFLVSKVLALRTPFNESMRCYEDNLFALHLVQNGCLFVAAHEAVSIWYLDNRSDQASGSTRVPWEAAMLLLDEAKDMISLRAQLSFKIRFVGTKFVRLQPIRFFFTAMKAILHHAVSTRNVVGVVYRSIILGYGR